MENFDSTPRPEPEKQKQVATNEENLELDGVQGEFDDLMGIVAPNQERIVQQLEADPDPKAKKKLEKYEDIF